MIHLGVFLITLSGLLFEIGLTRIYSATIWYHFAFVAVSVALLGWGLGGLAVYLLKKRIEPTMSVAAALTMIYGMTIPLCLLVVVQFLFTLERLPIYFISPLIPFFLAGMALSMIFDLRRAQTGSLYFADLVGASLGALCVTFLLQAVGGETAVLIAAILPFVAAACLSKPYRLAAISVAIVLTLVAVNNESRGTFRVIPGVFKAMRRQMDNTPGTKVAQTGWNAYSRIDAVEGFEDPYLARLYIDSDAWTSILKWDGNLASVSDMSTWYRAIPFRMFDKPETLIIGPGAGSHVLVALAAGSRKVTAVELNPLMLKFVRHYGARAGNLYDRPDVEVIQSEGRNYISRSDRKFDVILLGFVDSWASVASGGLSLSENYLYTTQAFEGYYNHLTDDGVLAILRWDVDVPRLVSNAIALLGVEEARKRIVVLYERREGDRENPPQMIFMFRKRPFTEAETAAIMINWTLAAPQLVPGRKATAPYDAIFNGTKTMAAYEAESPKRVNAVFDDSPFYFATEKPWGMPDRMRKGLTWLVGPVIGLLGAFVLFGKPRGESTGPYAASILYFCALGAGFITVELALLQHLTLLLGHPIFTLSVLLFTLLASSGLGSVMSTRVSTRAACLTVAAMGVALAIVMPRLVPALLPFSLSVRVLIAIALLAPLGFLMGMPFPQGLRRTGQGPLPAPPFYWGLNGVMSVIGSVATVLIALMAGFQVAMIVGAGLYVVAALASSAMKST